MQIECQILNVNIWVDFIYIHHEDLFLVEKSFLKSSYYKS